jgi:four helix bundle protein
MIKHNFRNLGIWIQSKSFAKEVYLATQPFPKAETFGLTSQIRRSVISIPSNIAEGCNLMTDKQLLKHLYIAMGSAGELETQLELAADLGFLEETLKNKLVKKVVEIQRMIMGFVKRIEQKSF